MFEVDEMEVDFVVQRLVFEVDEMEMDFVVQGVER